MMQFQADILQRPIDRPQTVETTAMGAAFLAGLSAGVYSSMDDILALRRTQRRFEPQMEPEQAAALLKNWRRAVDRAAKWETE